MTRASAQSADRSRSRRLWTVPLAVLGLAAVLVALSAVFALPGEHTVKGWLGLHYTAGGCGSLRHRGAPGHWRAERPLGEARDEVRAVRIGGGAYLVGGGARRGAKLISVRTFERYDLRTGRRTALPPLPTPLNHTGVAVYRGDIYVVGGAGTDLERATNRFWRYSLRDRRWTELSPMPTARTALGVAVLGGSLYAVGGKNSRVATAAVEVYSFKTHRWARLAPLPARRDHLSVAAHGGAVYVAGGRNEERGVMRSFDRYDPRTNRWTALPDMPDPTSGSGFLELGGRLVVAGGENPPKQYMTGRALAYDLRTRSWSDLPAMDRPRHGFASVAAGDRMFVFGGSRCPGQAVTIDSVNSLRVPGR